MKKILSALLALPLCFSVAACNQSQSDSSSSSSPSIRKATRNDLIITTLDTSNRSASIKIRPKYDITDLEIIIECYNYEHYDNIGPYYRLLETKIENLGDVFYGAEYIIEYKLIENEFTKGESIYKIEYSVKNGTLID